MPVDAQSNDTTQSHRHANQRHVAKKILSSELIIYQGMLAWLIETKYSAAARVTTDTNRTEDNVWHRHLIATCG